MADTTNGRSNGNGGVRVPSAAWGPIVALALAAAGAIIVWGQVDQRLATLEARQAEERQEARALSEKVAALTVTLERINTTLLTQQAVLHELQRRLWPTTERPPL